MTTLSTQPIPKHLREQMLQRMQSASEEDLVFAYEVMLFAEKARLWREIQQEASGEAANGLHQNIPELIRQYRLQQKQSA